MQNDRTKQFEVYRNYDFEHFTLSFATRMVMFILFVVNTFLYAFSFMNMLIIGNIKYTQMFGISNIIYLFLCGLFGVKTYLYNLFSDEGWFYGTGIIRSRRRHLAFKFIITTAANCLINIWFPKNGFREIFLAPILSIQLYFLISFILAYLPGGMPGMISTIQFIVYKTIYK